MKKKVIAALMTLTMLGMLAGCGSQQGASSGTPAAPETSTENTASEAGDSASSDDSIEIGLSLKTITNNEWQRVAAESVQKTVEDAGYKFNLVLAGGETEVAAQVNNIEDLISKGVDAIICAPMDGAALIPALEKAKAANIPVILIDASIDAGHEDLYVTLVAADSYKIGQTGAEKMIEAIGSGKVVTVRGAAGSEVSETRSKGFEETLEGSDVKLVNQQNGDWANETAMQVTENMLMADSEIKGIFVCSDGMLSGVISAVENVGRTGEITIISVDGNISAVDEIEAGNCYGTVGQYPSKVGQIAAELAIDLIEGNVDAASVEKFIDAGLLFMSADNLEESREVAY